MSRRPPSNSAIQLSVCVVTPRACARVAPTQPAPDRGRWAARRTLNGIEVTLRVLIVIALSVAAQAANAEDSLDRRLKAIVHQGTDCGRVGEGGSPRSAVIACVNKQFTSNRPFRARVDGC